MMKVRYRICDGDECVADVDASGNPLRAYAWGPGIDNLLSMTVFLPGSTNTYYAVKDHLGSVHALVDGQGVVVESFSYDAWGNVQSAVGSGQSATGNRYLFQGREYSFATGLYFFRARWYDPRLGRWLSNDPIGISGGLNLYEFCRSNPVNWKDPNGLFWRQAGNTFAGAISGGLAGAASGALTGATIGGAIGAAGGSIVPGAGTLAGLGAGASAGAGIGAVGGLIGGAISGGVAGMNTPTDTCSANPWKDGAFAGGLSGVASGAALTGGPVAGLIGGGIAGGIAAGVASDWDPALTGWGTGFGMGTGLLGGYMPAGWSGLLFSGNSELWGYNAGAYGGLQW